MLYEVITLDAVVGEHRHAIALAQSEAGKCVRQAATAIVAHVPGRGADDLGQLVTLHHLGAVEADDVAVVGSYTFV